MRGPEPGSSIFGKALNLRPVKPGRYGLIVRPKFDGRYMDQIGQKNKGPESACGLVPFPAGAAVAKAHPGPGAA